ncbi:MAG: Mut7-C RNAse domain-containing protein [Desulforhopalus sp.]
MKLSDVTGNTSRLFLEFHGDILDLLNRVPERGNTVIHELFRRASIKDILESLGVPHTEVGKIILDGVEQGFEKIAENEDHFEIFPLSPALPPTIATVLRPDPLKNCCLFLVDINVGRLSGLLRMVGCDAENVDKANTSRAIVAKAVQYGRILLTRNKDLLKHRELVYGRLVRNQDPDLQLREIINLYNLENIIEPYTRCISCNSLLADVKKEEIIDRLLPLTKRYFNHFKICTDCRKIYWQGSHHDKMKKKLEIIVGKNP